MNTEQTAWLMPSPHSKGLDPLGVQAPAIHIYGQLLPGITNVTDRARYYSFYPWIIRAFEKNATNKTHNALQEWIRRSDCLFTMVGIQHATHHTPADNDRHARALIGNRTLTSAVQNLEGERDITNFTALDYSTDRYFMNRLGGLGQYYIGTLVNLGVMTRQKNNIANIKEAGIPLAEAVESFVDSDLFIHTVRSGKITAKVLDELSDFCPCKLVESKKEHEALLDIFFARKALVAEPGEWQDDSGPQRRKTLKMLLHLIHSAAACEKPEGYSDQDVFRACVYTAGLSNEHVWSLPGEELEFVRRQWQVYQKHELFSVGVQSIFGVALHLLPEAPDPLFSAEDFKGYFSRHAVVKKAAVELGGLDFAAACDHIRKSLPDLKTWGNPLNDHEINHVRKALQSRQGTTWDTCSSVLANAGWVLLALLVRDDAKTGAYDPLPSAERLCRDYPLNLEALRHNAISLWKSMPVTDWFAWVAWHWGIEAHLHVARRKLRFQNNDTFHVIPTDCGLVRLETPDPSYTSPRFHQAVQILKDLGVVGTQGNCLTLTQLGHDILEENGCD